MWGGVEGPLGQWDWEMQRVVMMAEGYDRRGELGPLWKGDRESFGVRRRCIVLVGDGNRRIEAEAFREWDREAWVSLRCR
jgi:hypothetical protein